MHCLRIGSALAALLLSSGVLWQAPASADWQYTKWGMTEPEVVSASKGAAVKPTASEAKDWAIDGYTPALKTTYATGEFNFTAVFHFDRSQRLALMKLYLDDPSMSHELVAALRSKYGQEVDGSKSQITESYVWRTEADQINLLLIGVGTTVDDASLQYKPRQTAANEGL